MTVFCNDDDDGHGDGDGSGDGDGRHQLVPKYLVRKKAV